MLVASPYKALPHTSGSAVYVADTGAANAVTAITVPDSCRAVMLWFEKTGSKVRGRVGFAGEDHSATVTAADADATLGHHPADVIVYTLASHAKVLHIATSTANATLFGSWLFA